MPKKVDNPISKKLLADEPKLQYILAQAEKFANIRIAYCKMLDELFPDALDFLPFKSENVLDKAHGVGPQIEVNADTLKNMTASTFLQIAYPRRELDKNGNLINNRQQQVIDTFNAFNKKKEELEIINFANATLEQQRLIVLQQAADIIAGCDSVIASIDACIVQLNCKVIERIKLKDAEVNPQEEAANSQYSAADPQDEMKAPQEEARLVYMIKDQDSFNAVCESMYDAYPTYLQTLQNALEKQNQLLVDFSKRDAKVLTAQQQTVDNIFSREKRVASWPGRMQNFLANALDTVVSIKAEFKNLCKSIKDKIFGEKKPGPTFADLQQRKNIKPEPVDEPGSASKKKPFSELQQLKNKKQKPAVEAGAANKKKPLQQD